MASMLQYDSTEKTDVYTADTIKSKTYKLHNGGHVRVDKDLGTKLCNVYVELPGGDALVFYGLKKSKGWKGCIQFRTNLDGYAILNLEPYEE